MIRIENMSKYYGDFCAVENLNLEIPDGQILGLLGPNGAGKSTTLRIITGYLQASSGKVYVNGVDIAENPVAGKTFIGYLPESSSLYADMLVYDYLDFIADMRGLNPTEKQTRIQELCNLCSLQEVMHKKIAFLSKGYKQRVGLAMAMMSDPDVLILDEPTSGLDPNQIIEIRSIIKEIGRRKTVIFSTHILSEAEATCDRIVIVNAGKIVADGDVSSLISQQEKSFNVILHLNKETGDISSLIKEIASVVSVDFEMMPEYGEFKIKASEDVRKEVTKLCMNKDWDLLAIHTENQSLENVFTELTNEGNSNES